jgi:soluble lytic murein transglycosylase-like protein
MNTLLTNKTAEVQKIIISEILKLSDKYGINPNWILFLYYCESGLNPYIQNPNGTAYGLWQLIKPSADGLGINFDEYKKAGYYQIRYQSKFFAYWKSYLKYVNSFGTLYLLNFAPAYLAKQNEPFSKTISEANNLKKLGIITPNDWISYWNNEYKIKYKDNITSSSIVNTDGEGFNPLYLLLLLGVAVVIKKSL